MSSPTIVALMYDPSEVSERALSRGFAVALAGWDVPAPRLTIAELSSSPRLSVAFYTHGVGAEEDGFEHCVALFEDELSPAVAVIDAAVEEGAASPTVLTLVHADDVIHDEAWRVTRGGFERRFVREAEEGVERGVETANDSEVTLLPSAEEPALVALLRAHRGSTFLSSILGKPALPALMGALYNADRVVPVRLVAPDEASIGEATRCLVVALGRVEGRGAFLAPTAVGGVLQPAAHRAFVAAYDWSDPRDPRDLYRELSLGRVAGNLRFLRLADLEAMPATATSAGLYPVARLVGSALGGAAAAEATLGLRADGEGLTVVRGKSAAEAGPTFGELLRYLSLGWSKRTEAEEDLIGALMLKARVRVDATREG